MIKLTIFAACDKVLIDQGRNISLIVLADTFNLNIPSGQQVPPNAMLPKEWYVIAIWRASESEVGRSFTQITEFESPAGAAVLPRSVFGPFLIDEQRKQINTISIQAMPAGKPGIITIRTWLEEQGAKATEISSYEINVVHREAPSPDFIQKL